MAEGKSIIYCILPGSPQRKVLLLPLRLCAPNSSISKALFRYSSFFGGSSLNNVLAKCINKNATPKDKQITKNQLCSSSMSL